MAKKPVDVEFEDEEPVVDTDADTFVNEEDAAADPDASLSEEQKKKTKTQLIAEVEAARKTASERPDATAELGKAMDKLAERLTPQEREVVQQGPMETEEAFLTRLKTDLFDENKVGATFREAVLRYAGPIIQQQSANAYATALKLMRMDPDTGVTFRRYERETLDFVKKNFKGYEQSPQALELAFDRVKAAHIDELAQDIADRKIKEAEEKAKEKTKARPEPLGLEEGRTVAPRTAPKRVFTITTQTRAFAEERGISDEQAARILARRVSPR